MPILSDGRLRIDGLTGVGTYARALHAAIKQLTDRPLELTDRMSNQTEALAPGGRLRRMVRSLLPIARKPAQEVEGCWRIDDVFRLAQVHFDIFGRTLPIRLPIATGIAHWSYPLPIHVVGWLNVYTIHDLIPLTHPGLTSINTERHRRLIKAIVQSAAGIVTVSESSRRIIEATIDPCPLPIINCGQPVETALTSGTLPEGLESRRYLLVVGSVERRKNIAAIVAAYHAACLSIPLVIAGPDGSDEESLRVTAGSADVVRLPYMPRKTIAALIANARALVMLSLAEGFGLPVAEAMSLGTPVVTSSEGALAEVAGDAALKVAVTDRSAITQALVTITNDYDIWERLRGKGLARSAIFEPPRFVADLAFAYKTICGH